MSAPALPGGAALLLRALFKRGGKSGTVPASEFHADDLDAVRLARYNALFGFRGEALPITYYYLLAQRAHLATMLAPAFPFRLLGMIHA
ncbi:MAG: acyl dehydratase, partial [Burkholderiaceae bacterium]|nr:acyl dehydratase [Burkholderiaceae bacterium]